MLITTEICLLSLLLISGVNNACLNSDTLRFLGVVPATAHESHLKSICSSTYAQFRSCVDDKSFEEAIMGRLDVSIRAESAKYSYLHEELENVVAKFKKLSTKMEESGNFPFEVMDQLMRVKNLIPEDVGRLRKQILRSAHNCFAVQSHIAIGSLCLLSSEAATDFVSSTPEDSQLHQQDDSSAGQRGESFAIKVTPQAADEIFTACMPLVQGSCIYRKINKVLALFEGRDTAESDDACPSDLINCLRDQSSCKAEVKNTVLQTFFKPFSSHLIGSDEIASIYGVLRNTVNGFWEKGMKQLFGTYSRLFDLTAAPFEKLTTLTHKSYQYVFNLLRRSGSQLNSTIPLDFENSATSVLPFSKNIQFVVTTDGRDVVADGVASGVYIQNSPLIPALVGLAFVLVQMFV